MEKRLSHLNEVKVEVETECVHIHNDKNIPKAVLRLLIPIRSTIRGVLTVGTELMTAPKKILRITRDR